ncbi:MAG TPA: type IV pilus twitching motility protein PilT [Gammaproteobacteria bacterium]|nr:type IV pilus twitching motility protein PilT [Gammaproteobacteria bacterium]
MQLTELLALTIEKNASDLHISPEKPPILRIHGELVFLTESGILSADKIKTWIYQTFSEDQLKEFEANWELDYALVLSDHTRFRINAYKQSDGIAAVFRYIPSLVPSMEQLGLPEIFKKILNAASGLVLITGATGSGKSTTLASMIHHLNAHENLHIITLEDPIEFIHISQKSLITQRQVNRDTRSFNAALRSALRQDPDIILLGEMRDLETIRLALTAAETGHLVMATLHTHSAPRTINRIIDVFPPGEKQLIRNMLAESLQAVICQTLIKNQGGRIAAFEIMIGTPAMRNLIREDKMAQMVSAMEMGAASGMCTLKQYLQNLIANRKIDAKIVSI